MSNPRLEAAITVIKARLVKLEAANPINAVSAADVMGEVRGLKFALNVIEGAR